VTQLNSIIHGQYQQWSVSKVAVDINYQHWAKRLLVDL